MDSNNLLRLSYIISFGQANTLDNNIAKIAKLAIYDSKLKWMTLGEIRAYIQSNYQLEFTIEEIKNSIDKKASNILYNNNGKYSLALKEIQKIKEYEERQPLESCVDRFINQNSITTYDKQGLIDLIKLYIYEVINTNKQMILSLMKNDTEKLSNEFKSLSLDNSQRDIINKFLNWNDRIKNQYIFNMISSSVEYCMLTVKRDIRSLNNVFRGKKFYVDTNVILRLIGINNEERKEVINSFIKKCNDAGIELYYTNFTKIEIESTINSFIQQIIPKLSMNSSPINPKIVEKITHKETPGFHQLYYDWCLLKGNHYKDIDSFKFYLLKLYEDAVKSYKFISFPSFKDSRFKEEYIQFFDSLKEFKADPSKKDEVFSIDINNFMFLLHKRKDEKQGNHFWEVNDYIISTDNKMCRWSRQTFPGVVPIVVLPSVWHSLILKFKGRTDNDYRAFCLFLNLRHREEEDLEERKRSELLEYVNFIPEEADIKERVIENIDENLNGKYAEIESPKKIVENAYIQIKEEYDKKKEAELLLKLKSKGIEAEDNTLKLIAQDRTNKRLEITKKISIPVLIFIGGIIALGLLTIAVCIIISAFNSNIIVYLKIASFAPLITVIVALIGILKLLLKLRGKVEAYINSKRQIIFSKQYQRLKKQIDGLNNNINENTKQIDS